MRPIIRIIALALLAGVSAAGIQKPLSASSYEFLEAESADDYQFKWPIKRVAIIGAGPSGIVAYRELTEAGFSVRIFERDSVPGGNWHYTEEAPLDAPMPNAPPAIADYVPSLPPASINLPYSEVFEDDGEVWRDHRGPKPIWESLKSNAPAALQQWPQWPWPEGTKWELSQDQLSHYVRSYASYLNINSNDENNATSYNTRVERIEKRINHAGQEQGWRLWLKSVVPTEGHTYRATWWTEDFDAVVVAVGRFSAPSMPPIPGLEGWVRTFPGLLRHSRQYRRPEAYANQTVLIIGASVSGSEISRDLNRHARQVYQSFRPDTDPRRHYRLENYLGRIPKNTTLVGEIKRFLPIPEGSPIQSGLIELKNGTIITGIDSVILSTGFRYSFPFLPQYYDGASYVPHEGSAKSVSSFLPSDGSHIRNMYLDLLYIRDPTLAFLGMTLATQSFVLSEYMTLGLAKVWSNTGKLPSTQMMWEWYEKCVEERGGLGKNVMFLGPRRYQVILRYMVGWLNEQAVKYGGKQIDGAPKYYPEMDRYWAKAHYGGRLKETMEDGDEEMLASLGLSPVMDMDETWPVYDDNW